MKKLLSAALVLSMGVTALAGCNVSAQGESQGETQPVQTTVMANTDQALKAPKYVFLFIGDGMSYPQIQSTSDYLGALKDADYWQAQPSLDDNQGAILDGPEYLNFMNFEAAGSAVTYDSNSFAPDSASTATSISTGHKTYSGTINMDETMTVKYETIAEQLRDEGYDIGVITSVNLNHATPAAFYCHQASRNNYYEIGQEMVASDFDYFAGGALLDPEGENGDQVSVYDLAEDAGYKVVTTQAEAEKVSAEDEKVVIVGETLADSDSLSYENDRANGEWALSDYVSKGIEVLEDNDKGFFMMVEGGKIDWACHANDAGSTINDTIALADAVDEAVAFANEHPDETLILVTGDHETGGLTIGYAGTDYDTYLTNLSNQKISYAKFDSDYVTKYKAEQTPFETMMQDVEELFGLKMSGDADDKLVLTEYEIGLLRDAYAKTLADEKADENNQEEYVLYGTYEPLSVTITHLLNNKSGIDFSSYAHTGLPVAVFAQGVGQENFGGFYDNTDIYHKLADLMDIQ